MHRRSVLARAMLAAAVTTLWAAGANAQQQFQTTFSGINEVPSPILSQGQGTLSLSVNAQQQTLTYTLTYSNPSTTPVWTVTQAHIQFGTEHQEGFVIVFLCTTLNNGPPTTPTCTSPSGTITRTITAVEILSAAPQGLAAADFNGLVTILTSGAAYANIHTTQFPTGEIRGQIQQCSPKGGPPDQRCQ
jgi:hypothetical protein